MNECVSVNDVLARYAEQWDPAVQLDILKVFIEDNCDLTVFEAFLRTIVDLEAENAMPITPVLPSLAAMSEFFGNNLVAQVAARITPVECVVTAPTADGRVVVVSVPSELYKLMRECLLYETALPDYDADGEIVCGCVAALAEDRVVAAISNSAHGPWLDVWFHSNGCVEEDSPPPVHSLDAPIECVRPDGRTWYVCLLDADQR